MSVTTDLLEGIAGMIVAGVSGTSYNPAAATVNGGILLKLMPASPDRVITLTAVNQGDDITMPLGQVMVQVRGRGLPNRPTDVDDLLDSIFDVLHGTTNLAFGSVIVVQMNRKVSVPMGMDDLKRWERVDQYYLDLDFPPTANRPAQGSW
jgi:hypothetical protein